MHLFISPRWTRCLQALMLGVTLGSVQLRAKAQGKERLVAPTNHPNICMLAGKTLSSQCDAADRGNRSKPLRELMAAEETVNHFDLPWRQNSRSWGALPESGFILVTR
jgi:hypothetical protein